MSIGWPGEAAGPGNAFDVNPLIKHMDRLFIDCPSTTFKPLFPTNPTILLGQPECVTWLVPRHIRAPSGSGLFSVKLLLVLWFVVVMVTGGGKHIDFQRNARPPGTELYLLRELLLAP